jgi:hypothetical protein
MKYMRANVLVLVLTLVLFLAAWQGVMAAPPWQGGDLALITAPKSNDVVRGQVAIMGSATHSQFQFYKVEYALEPVGGDESWGIVGAIREQPVLNGQLETWDTTEIPDGSYSLRLRVVRLDGNYDEALISQVVVANALPEEPTETPTPEASLTPTITPTPLPPTPTIVIEQPALPSEEADAAAPTRTPLPTPDEGGEGGIQLDTAPLKSACLYGTGAMFGLFLLFGVFAALRNLIYSIIGRKER